MHSDLFRLHATIEEAHWWFVGRRRIMRDLVTAVLPPTPGGGGVIADIGCGTGANIAALSGMYECIGVDTSKDAVELARLRYPGVRFLLGEAPKVLGQQVSAVDLFLLMDVLEHLEDDVGTLSALVSAARPGALFLITVPADMRLWSAHDEIFGHYRRYDRETLRSLWSGLPVEAVLLSHFSSRLYPVVRAVRTLTRLRGGTFGAQGTDFRIPPAPMNRALTRLFSGEGVRLTGVLRGDSSPYRSGSSLIAILRVR